MKHEQIRRGSKKSKMMMKNPQEEQQDSQEQQPQQPPALFLCPISLEIMRDPVIVCTGQTYDRPSIEKWIRDGHRSCPITMLHLHDLTLIPNIIVRQLIEAWCSSEESASAMFASPFHHQNLHQNHQQCQSQSEMLLLMNPSEQHQQNLFILSEIPPSRTAEDDEDEEEGEGAVNREQVLILLRRIAKGQEVKQSVGRLKAMAKDEISGSSSVSEKKVCCCIMEAGGALLMASMLADELLLQEDGGLLLHKEGEDNPCEEIMSLLAILCRSGSREVIGAVLSESGALECVIGHLSSEIGMACRMNAAMLLKRLLLTDEIRAAITRFSTGFFAGLLDLIDRSCSQHNQQQHCSSRSRKSLVKLLYMACSHKPNRFKAVEQGAIEILTKMLSSFSSSCSSSSASSSNNNNGNNSGHDDRTAVDERDRTVQMGERALAALELLCTVEAGRSAVCRCTAAVHCAVRMLVGYSRQCTEHATGCLLLVCQSGPVEVLQIAMKAGARRQLLLLLQSDCTGRAKKKALELLKLFHAIFFVAGGEQHVSSDFKNVDLYSN